MKGLTGSAGAVTVIALGLYPGAATATSLSQPDYGPTRGVENSGSPSTGAADGSSPGGLTTPGRRLQVVNDDALDVNGTVSGVTSFRCQIFPIADGCVYQWLGVWRLPTEV